MSRRSRIAALACALTFLGIGVSTGAAAPSSLLLPQSQAFSILGYSCGGIQEQAFATGFDPASGYPTGDVYIQTRCGGSGRGGGYHSTTYSAWVGVSWDFAGNVLSSARLTTAPTVSSTFSATDANGDEVYDTGTAAYLVVPAPGAPTGLSAVQVGDQFQVSWAAAPANPAVVTSSTLTATPVGSTAPILTATVSGSAASGLVGPLSPQTSYQITVVSSTAGGSSPASAPIAVASASPSVVPSAPTGLHARWTAPGYPTDTLAASWSAAVSGDSPLDQYQITIKGSDGGGTFTQTVAGSTLTATFAVTDIPDWSIQVRAHDTAGWGPWSARRTLGGV